MLETEQNVGVKDAIFAVCLDAVCREGIRRSEIAELLERTGLSQSAYYGQFQLRKNLLSAHPRDRHTIWLRWFESEIEARYEATGGSLEIIADVLQTGFEDPKFFGFAFAFIEIVAERSSLSRSPFLIASEEREYLRRFIEQLATRMGIQHPNLAASAAVLVIERTIERTLITGSLKEAQDVRLLFQCLQHA